MSEHLTPVGCYTESDQKVELKHIEIINYSDTFRLHRFLIKCWHLDRKKELQEEKDISELIIGHQNNWYTFCPSI